MTQFMKYLLSSKKHASSVAADPEQTEEFLLTVGLAYRDMATIHLGRDPVDPRSEPPEYMNIKSTLLSQRVIDVCESVLLLVCTAMKSYKEKSKKAVAVKGRKVVHTKSSSSEPGTSSESDQDASRSNDTAGPSGASRVRNDDRPIVLARPRPRKRPRAKPIGEFEEEEVRLSVPRLYIQNVC